jgi:phospholipid/cholesterol/gamma-HCH transport system substrate-binding protein
MARLTSGSARTRRDTMRVGIFVLVAGALLVGALLWIAGSRIFRPVDTYTVVFDDSVSGLNRSANVEYQGVVVGRVRDIRLTNDRPPKVDVIVEVEPGTPVRTDTVAALLGSLVTGIKYIQFQGGTGPPLPPGGTIRGEAASLEQFRNQLSDVADRATKIMRKLDEQVFTPENAAKVTDFVSNLEGVAETLNTTMKTFRAEETGKQVATLVRELTATTENLNRLVADVYGRRDMIFGGLEQTLHHLDETVTATRDLVRTTQSQIAGTSGSLGTLMTDLNAATHRLQETIDVIRSNPSVLLWGRKIPEREFEK